MSAHYCVWLWLNVRALQCHKSRMNGARGRGVEPKAHFYQIGSEELYFSWRHPELDFYFSGKGSS